MALLFLLFLPWLFSFTGTAAALGWLQKFSVLDTPNDRSNHKAPVPRGGGIAMVGTALVFMTLYGVDARILLAGLELTAVSFIDDLKGLAVRWRLIAQLLAVMLATVALPGTVFGGVIPHAAEWVIIVLAWIWFINLTNFMDGIDGITSMQTIWVMLGICLVTAFAHTPSPELVAYAVIIAASVLGFYWFNRHPARLFMGDVGSVVLGFLTFYLLVQLAMHGEPAAALILPAYYLSDSGYTLLARLLRGEKVWEAHSEHAYQQAVRRGLTHYQVVCRLSGLNILLIVLAILSTYGTISAVIMLAIAYVAAACMMKRLLT